MKFKPHFSANKGSDVLRFSLAGLAFIAVFAVYWNRASIPLSDVEAGYQGFVLQGHTQEGHIISETGVSVLRDWIEKKSTPTFNPISIVWHNVGYRNNRDDYELIIGLRGIPGERKFREYGIYQKGNTVYLQIEPIGSDRVLRTSFTARQLENAISSYIEGEFEVAKPARADETPNCSFQEAFLHAPAVEFLRNPSRFADAFYARIHPPSHRKLGIVHRDQCR